jgi:D-alanyl-D-alanine carboxypeptidase/D-alanyl-D-alanine-endopeptidase (penicillin-binding protein 4)
MKLNNILIIGFSLLLFTSCAVKKHKFSVSETIKQQLSSAPINQQHHIGLIIREINASTNLFEQNADHYFTPASNTKLFTFYAALNMLGDSIPTFEYEIKQDSLIVWPMADASFLHFNFKDQKAFDFLKNAGKDIYIVSGRYQGEKFGAGWSWDDFNADYQTEITDFPIYGNYLRASASASGGIKYAPDMPSMFLNDIITTPEIKNIQRNFNSNNLLVPSVVALNFKQNIPLYFTKHLLTDFLTDTLLATGLVVKPVIQLPWRPVPLSAKVVYNISSDTLYKHMLQPSDNFIAEELLLNCAAANHLTMKTDDLIKTATEKYLTHLPDKIRWVDGSGLSRLNLFTPRDMVTLLQSIYDKVNNEKRLFDLLPNGGKSGTLRNMFKNTPETFIYAKSGSLSNNYNLSGFLIGKSGKKYIFSYMNNNYVHSTAETRSEVERMLTYIHEKY